MSSTLATTGLNCEKTEVEWKIEHFARIKSDEGLVKLQTFEVTVPKGANCCETTWKVFLSTRKRSWIGVHHKLKSSHKNIKVYSCFRVFIKSKDDPEKSFFDSKTEIKPMNGGVDWGFLKVVRRSTFIGYLPLIDDSLTIQIGITVFTSRTTEVVGPQGSAITDLEQQLRDNLMKDLNIFETSEELNDIKIICMDGEEVAANKGILSVRSRVFATMLKSGLEENKSGVVKVEDISKQTIQTILHYVYTGEISSDELKSVRYIKDVVYAAEKYEMEDLRLYCDEILSQRWIPADALESLEIATKFRLTKTSSQIQEYFTQSSRR